MNDQITLKGFVQYNPSYPPRDAKKGYVAKITGRVPGPMKYEREFLGSEVTIYDGDEGLYELQIGEKKGGYTRYYHVILEHAEHGLIVSENCGREVPKIAKLLDDGVPIADAVEVTDLWPSTTRQGVMMFLAVARTKAAAKKNAAAQTVDAAVSSCLEVLKDLNEKERKSVLRELRKELSTHASAS